MITDITEGDGAEATAGSTVSVHYVGVAHSTGEEFDASYNRGDAAAVPPRRRPGHPGLGPGRAGHEGRRPPPARHPAAPRVRRPRRRRRDQARRDADLRRRPARRQLSGRPPRPPRLPGQVVVRALVHDARRPAPGPPRRPAPAVGRDASPPRRSPTRRRPPMGRLRLGPALDKVRELEELPEPDGLVTDGYVERGAHPALVRHRAPTRHHRWSRCEERQRRASRPGETTSACVAGFRGSGAGRLPTSTSGAPAGRGARSASDEPRDPVETGCLRHRVSRRSLALAPQPARSRWSKVRGAPATSLKDSGEGRTCLRRRVSRLRRRGASPTSTRGNASPQRPPDGVSEGVGLSVVTA